MVNMRIESIKARQKYGSYPISTSARYTVTVQVVVAEANNAADAAGMVAAAISGCGSVAEIEAERNAARAERDSLAELITTPLRKDDQLIASIRREVLDDLRRAVEGLR